MKYKVTWSDGTAAASRGGRPDKIVHTTIECDMEDIWTVLRLMKVIGYLCDVDGGLEDSEFKEEIFDYFGVDSYDPDDEDLSPFLKTTQKTFEDCNLDDIDGGEPWVISVTDSSGNVLYECGYEDENAEMDYDEAYEYLIDDVGVDSRTAGEILDDLDEYTKSALNAAVDDLEEASEEEVVGNVDPKVIAHGKLTEKSIAEHLTKKGFSASIVKLVIRWLHRSFYDASFIQEPLERQFDLLDPALCSEYAAFCALAKAESEKSLTEEELKKYITGKGFSAEVVKLVIDWFRRGYFRTSCTKERLEKAFSTLNPTTCTEHEALITLMNMNDYR